MKSVIVTGIVLSTITSLAAASPRTYHPRSSKPSAPSHQEPHSSTHIQGQAKNVDPYAAPHDRSTPGHATRENHSTKSNSNHKVGKPARKPSTF